MRRIRIGKDFRILWTVKVNGETMTPDYKDKLTLVLVNPRLSAVNLDFYINEGQVIADITPELQKYLGVHKLTLWYKGEDGLQTVVDEINPFCLVKYTTEEDEGSEDHIQTYTRVEIESDMMVSFKGESAYETWLKNGHEGSEMDFLEWLKGENSVTTEETGKEYNDI